MACLFAADAQAQDAPPLITNTFGSVGLVDLPSARMAPDGDFSMSANYSLHTQRYTLGFQALPWLEATFRYSGLSRFEYPAYPVYWDRSFAAKIRLWNESDILPAVVVGADDLVGTGIYSGEYVAASKSIGPVDVTLGLGWGRLADTNTLPNPLGKLIKSFDTRPDYLTAPGESNLNILFHGKNIGVFGGASWITPITGLSLTAEYSSDRYTLETTRGTFRPANQINFGATYHITDSTSVNLGWLYGRTISAGLIFHTDPVHNAFPERLGPEAVPPTARTSEEREHALDVLYGQNSPQRRLGAQMARTSSAIDILWRANGVEIIGLHGTNLEVNVAAARPCEEIAASVGSYDFSVDMLVVHLPGGATERCFVPRAPVSIATTATVASMDGVPAAPFLLRAAAPSAVTIDARGAAPTSSATVTKQMRADIAGQDLAMLALSLQGGVAKIYYSNPRYYKEMDAVDRIIRVAMKDLPPDVEEIQLISTQGGVPLRQFSFLRAQLERSALQAGDIGLADNFVLSPPPLSNPALQSQTRSSYPQFSWALNPQLRQQLFDPSNPYGVQVLASLTGAVALAPGLSVSGEVEGNIIDTFSTGRASNSALPHVRSDFVTFFTKGKNGVGDLEVDYQLRLAPELSAIFRGGYLESMFGGAGAEFLWQPENSRFALGADLYAVKERAFDRLFGFQKYNIVTGHFSLYYASPWHGIDFAVHAGRYLAGDYGVTVEATRRFSTGVEIGFFATKTNVSTAQFGEGGFDKGIIIRLPLEWILPFHSQNSFNLDLRPVQRDGGQRLDGDDLLYQFNRRNSPTEISRSLE